MSRSNPTASLTSSSANHTPSRSTHRVMIALVLTGLDAAVLFIYCAPLLAVALRNPVFLVFVIAVVGALFASLARVWRLAIPTRKP